MLDYLIYVQKFSKLAKSAMSQFAILREAMFTAACGIILTFAFLYLGGPCAKNVIC